MYYIIYKYMCILVIRPKMTLSCVFYYFFVTPKKKFYVSTPTNQKSWISA